MRNIKFAAIAALLHLSIGFASSYAQPPPPAGFVAADATPCGVIAMSWTPVAGVSGYRIYRDGDLIQIATQPTSSHLDYEMAGIGVFSYCIESFNASGTSAQVCDGADLPVSPVTVNPVDWYNDVFPADPGVAPGTPAFAKNEAVLATGRNTAVLTGDPTREVIPGEDVIVGVAGPVGAVVGVNMIFRIKPGPGNYCVTGFVGGGLQPDPDVPCPPACVPGDGTFWGDLMAVPGMFATPGAVALHAAAPSGWSINVWNSRPCMMVAPGVWTSVDPGTGFSILPDNLFCPGTHVEYYFRVEFVGGAIVNVPDPNCVIQRRGEGSIDGHRWAQFGVLPDLWKEPAFGGLGLACALVVDLDDGQGNERVWVSSADSMSATAPARYGAHNGWHAVGTLTGSTNPVNVDDPGNNRTPGGAVGFTEPHGGQPGTTWDLYNVKGAQDLLDGNAGSLGGRLGMVPVGATPPGPTVAMLTAYYRLIILLSGDRDAAVLGPFPDRSQDDIGLLEDFLTVVPGTPMPRALYAVGNGFAESEDAAHPAFLAVSLGADLVSGNYGAFAGNPNPGTEIMSVPPVSLTPEAHGLVNLPSISHDVLMPLPAFAAVASAFYEPVGAFAPYVAAVYAPPGPPRPYVSLLEGWNLEHLTNSRIRIRHMRDVLNNAFGSICAGAIGPAVGVEPILDPGPRTRLRLAASRTPVREGNLEFTLGVERAGTCRVTVHDLSGRRVHVVADREFTAGRHALQWDGTGRDGRRVAAGVFIVRAAGPNGAEASLKVAWLR